MGVAAKLNTALEVDEERRVFRVSRQTFVDPAILESERREIFDKVLAVSRAQLRVAAAGRFPDPSGRRPQHPVCAQRRRCVFRPVEHLPA